MTSSPSYAIEEGKDEAIEARERYRAAHDATYGAAPPLDELLSDLDDLNATFQSWVSTRIG